MRTTGLMTILLGGLACARPQPAPSEATLPVETFTLDNGLRIILHRDSTVPLVFFSTCFQVSAAEDPPGRTGLAHLLEHLLIRGTAVPATFDYGVPSHGDTNFDSTCYRQRLPAHELETGLWREAERLNPAPISAERLEAERIAVKHEIRQRFENRPDFARLIALRRALWPELERWDFVPVGRRQDIDGISREDAERFRQQWYVPAAATIVIAGDFEPEATKRLVNKWLGPLRGATPAARIALSRAPALQAGRRLVSGPPSTRASVSYAWRAPGPFAPGEAELQLLARVLGDGDGGRILRAFERQQLALESAGAEVSHEGGMGSLLVTVTPASGQRDLTRVERVLDGLLAELAEQPITGQEHAQAVALMEARLAYDQDAFEDRVYRFHLYSRHLDRPDGWKADVERFRRTSPASIAALARKLFDRGHRSEVILVPPEEERGRPR